MRASILAYPGCWAMSVMTVKDFFTIANRLEEQLGREVSFVANISSYQDLPVKSANGSMIFPDSSFTSDNSIIVIPPIDGTKLPDSLLGKEAIIAWLQKQHQLGVPIIALTTGVFLLAEAGLLKGQVVATHWAFLKYFAQKYPSSRFISHKSYTFSNNIFSTGSLNGSIDSLLELIAQERGKHFAQLCASHGLFNLSENLTPVLLGRRNHDDLVILKTQEWIEDNYNRTISVNQLAQMAHYSERNFKRRFKLATGIAPIAYIQNVRIEKAKKLLLVTQMTVNEVAYAVNYENVSFFIRLFKKFVGKTPKQYRASFQSKQ